MRLILPDPRIAAPAPDLSGREADRRAFLARAGFGDATREPLAGDASTRAYERLLRSGPAPLIFMDAPPAAESAVCSPDATPQERIALGYNATARLAGGSVEAFAAIAGWLEGQGLSAPRVYAFDAPAGFAVLEDLGPALFAQVLSQGGDEALVYDAAIDTLAALQSVAPPAVLEGNGVQWPLLIYDALAMTAASDLFIDWLPALGRTPPFDASARAEWEAIWEPVWRRAQACADVFCHRDYHAENLIWRPDREGPAQVGLLDFQDAVRAPRAWDLSMLLHDARRDVSPDLRAHALERYIAVTKAAPEALRADFAVFGALNIVRIIGVFHRLVGRDGKLRYQGFLPRMWGYLDETLTAPELAPLARWLDRHVSPEARA